MAKGAILMKYKPWLFSIIMVYAQPLDDSSLLCVISHLNSFQFSRSGSSTSLCANISSLSIALWHYIVFISWEPIWRSQGLELEVALVKIWNSEYNFNASVLSCIWVRLFVTPLTAARQAPLSMEFSRQEYWSGLPFLTSEDLSDPGIEPVSPAFSAMAGRFFTTEIPGKPCNTALFFFFFFFTYFQIL